MSPRNRRRLGLESLESRQLLAVYTVDTLVDEADGNVAAGDLSLREAIGLANVVQRFFRPDTIRFAPGLQGTIDLTLGELVVSEPLTITGPGASLLAIDAAESRIFRVVDSFTASGLTLRGGTGAGGGTTGNGGAVYVDRSTVTLRGVEIRDNFATGLGGGIYATGVGANVTILHSTIAENFAQGDGGAAVLQATATTDKLRIFNSTVSANNSGAVAGGIRIMSGSLALTNCTIASNRAVAGAGGIVGTGVLLNNTIVAGNTAGESTFDTSMTVVAGSSNNLIGDAFAAGGLQHGVNGNIVGNAGVGTISVFAVIDVEFSGPSPRVQTLVSRSPALDAGSNALAVDNLGSTLITDQRGSSRIQNGTGLGSIVDIGAFEALPPSLLVASSADYVENNPPLPLLDFVAVVDEGDFRKGALSVAIAAGASAGDRLSLFTTGDGPGQINRSGDFVTYEGNQLGFLTQNAALTTLKVAISASVSPAAIEALARAVAYDTTSDTPGTDPRNVTFVLDDGTGGTSGVRNVALTVAAANDRPRIADFGTGFSWTEGDPPAVIAPAATIEDPDSPDFDGGRLTVRFVASTQPTDRLAILSSGDISTTADEVLFAGAAIGTFSGGTNGIPLVVLLNAQATPARVQALLRSVAFENTSDNPLLRAPAVRAQVLDGDGGTSNAVTKRISIVPVNDAPVLEPASGGSVGYTRGDPALPLLTTATVTDPDSPNFGGGRLVVRILSGGSTSNRLEIGGPVFTFDGDRILRSGVHIGTRNAEGGIGTTRLEIVFTADATPGIVQQLVRAIRFRTEGASSTTSRVVEFFVTDGDGGASNRVTKTVVVA